MSVSNVGREEAKSINSRIENSTAESENLVVGSFSSVEFNLLILSLL